MKSSQKNFDASSVFVVVSYDRDYQNTCSVSGDFLVKKNQKKTQKKVHHDFLCCYLINQTQPMYLQSGNREN